MVIFKPLWLLSLSIWRNSTCTPTLATHTIYETILLLLPSHHHHHKLMHSLGRDLPLPWIYAHAKYVWFYCLFHICVPPEPSKMSLIPMSLLFLGTPSMVREVLCNYSAEMEKKYFKEHNILNSTKNVFQNNILFSKKDSIGFIS